jgi:hypothetical protein
MKIHKTKVAVGSSLVDMDTIELDGGLWLVPIWIDNRTTGSSKPGRHIRIDQLRHQKSSGNLHDFILNGPIPKGVIDGSIPPESVIGFDVVDDPDLLNPNSRLRLLL